MSCTRTQTPRQTPVVIGKGSPILLFVVLSCWICLAIFKWTAGLFLFIWNPAFIRTIQPCTPAERRTSLGLPDETPEHIRKIRVPTDAELEVMDCVRAPQPTTPPSLRKTHVTRFRSALKRTISIPARRLSMTTKSAPTTPVLERRHTIPKADTSRRRSISLLASSESPVGWLTIPGTPIPVSLDLSSSPSPPSPRPRTRSLSSLRIVFPPLLVRRGPPGSRGSTSSKSVIGHSTEIGSTATSIDAMQGANAPASPPTTLSIAAPFDMSQPRSARQTCMAPAVPRAPKMPTVVAAFKPAAKSTTEKTSILSSRPFRRVSPSTLRLPKRFARRRMTPIAMHAC